MADGTGTISFLGTWMCQFYRWPTDTIEPPGPPFPLTIEQGPGNTLTGFFPTPERGKNAIMKGTTTRNGRVWTGTFEGLEKGTIVFVLSEGGNTFYGAWVPDEKEGPPQPWWGTRATSEPC